MEPGYLSGRLRDSVIVDQIIYEIGEVRGEAGLGLIVGQFHRMICESTDWA